MPLENNLVHFWKEKKKDAPKTVMISTFKKIFFPISSDTFFRGNKNTKLVYLVSFYHSSIYPNCSLKNDYSIFTENIIYREEALERE